MRKIALLLLLAACGGSTEPDGPVPAPVQLGPTNVTIVSASDTTVRLRNTGGPGTYILEAWGRRISNIPSGCFTSDLIDGRCPVVAVALGDFGTVTVLAGYDETLGIEVSSAEVYGYKVFSRPVNTAIYTQTGCVPVATGAWLTFRCT